MSCSATRKIYFFKKYFWTIISKPVFSTVFQHKWSGNVPSYIRNVMALQNKYPCISYIHNGLQFFQVCSHIHSHHKPIKKARQELPSPRNWFLVGISNPLQAVCLTEPRSDPWPLSTSPEHSAARGLQICTLWSQDKKHLLLANLIGL